MREQILIGKGRGMIYVALLTPIVGSAASDWSRWRGPEGSGISKETDWKPEALSSGTKIKWRSSVGTGYACISVAGKNVFTTGYRGNKDTIYCFDAETGKVNWTFPYACEEGNNMGPGTEATPVVDGAQLFQLSRTGLAFCLDAKSGRPIWQQNLMAMGGKKITWGLAGSPLVVGNIVIYNACSSGIALAKTNGQRVWASAAGEGCYASPVLFKHRGLDCVAIFSLRNVYVVDVRTGNRLYAFHWETDHDVNAPDPVYFDGKLFLTSGYGRGCTLLDISTNVAKPLWENKNMASHFCSPVYFDGNIYGVDGQTGGGRLRCLDPRTGQVKWSQSDRFENMTIAGGKIVAINSGGDLVISEANPTAYREIARANILPGGAKKWTAPVLANGHIYCRDGEGNVVCVDVR